MTAAALAWTSPKAASQAKHDVLEDGSLIVSREDLALLGDGDEKRGRRELRMLFAMQKDRTIMNGPTDKPESVRFAVPADEKALFDLLMLDLKDNAERFASISEAKVIDVIQTCTRKKGGVCGVIDNAHRVPVAVTIMHPFEWWWSRQWYIFEIVNFVHPDYRNSQNAVHLLDFQRWVSDEWTRQFGHRVPLMCGVLGAARTKAKIMLYRRKFAQAGAAFVYPSPFEGGWR